MSFKNDPNARYRIQNVDFTTYLQARIVENESEIVMRPMKEDDRQLWSFIPQGGNAIKIQNAASQDSRHHRLPLYLTLSAQGVVCQWDSQGLKSWTIVENEEGDGYTMTTSGTNPYKDDIYLAVNDSGKINFVEERRTDDNDKSGDDRTWRIVGSNGGSTATADPPAYTPVEANITYPFLLVLKGHTSSVNCAAFSHDGKYIVSGSDDSDVRVWDAQTGTANPLRLSLPSPVHSVAFSPNGRHIAVGCGDGNLVVWDTVTREEITCRGHSYYILSLRFSQDGRKLVSSSADGSVRIWDAQTGTHILCPVSQKGIYIFSVDFSGDSKRIVAASDRDVMVMDANSGRLVWQYRADAQFAAFSPDTQTVVSVGYPSGDVSVRNADTGVVVAKASKQHAEGTLAVVFTSGHQCCAVSPDGRCIATRNRGKPLHVWDSKTGLVAATYDAHRKFIRSIAFSPDSRRLLTTSDDHTIHVHTLDC